MKHNPMTVHIGLTTMTHSEIDNKMRVSSATFDDGVLCIVWKRNDETGVILTIGSDASAVYGIKSDPETPWGETDQIEFNLHDGWPEVLVKEVEQDAQ